MGFGCVSTNRVFGLVRQAAKHVEHWRHSLADAARKMPVGPKQSRYQAH